MSPNPILLMGPATTAEQLRRPGEFDHVAEPYQALEALAGGKYQTVLMDAALADLPALVRAVRRVARPARVLAVCDAAGEASLRLAPRAEVDDYFMLPISPADEERVFGPRAKPALGAPAAGAGNPGALTPEQIGHLVEAASSIEGLQTTLQDMVMDWTGLEVEWFDATEEHGAHPLLLLDAELPKVLCCEDPRAVPPAAGARLAALQALTGALAGQARRMEAMHRLAITDHLTGAYNRRYFEHFAHQLLARALAENFRVTLLMFDIDNFKRYNDTYGHAAGDEILRETAELLRTTTREIDVVARIGGDEFAVLFWDAEPPRQPNSQHPHNAVSVARRFRKALSEHHFAALGREAKGALTISGGLAACPGDGQSLGELMRHADQALRQAKASGKNRIYLVGDLAQAE